jgi:hypothetical protein
VQGEIYGLCGIDVNTENNSWTKRLAKGFLDGSIFSKAELIHMIGNLNLEEIKKVALYIMNNIGSIIGEMIQSSPMVSSDFFQKTPMMLEYHSLNSYRPINLSHLLVPLSGLSWRKQHLPWEDYSVVPDYDEWKT